MEIERCKDKDKDFITLYLQPLSFPVAEILHTQIDSPKKNTVSKSFE